VRATCAETVGMRGPSKTGTDGVRMCLAARASSRETGRAQIAFQVAECFVPLFRAPAGAGRFDCTAGCQERAAATGLSATVELLRSSRRMAVTDSAGSGVQSSAVTPVDPIMMLPSAPSRVRSAK